MSNNPHRDPWHKDSWPEVAAELETENKELRARIAQLEEALENCAAVANVALKQRDNLLHQVHGLAKLK